MGTLYYTVLDALCSKHSKHKVILATTPWTIVATYCFLFFSLLKQHNLYTSGCSAPTLYHQVFSSIVYCNPSICAANTIGVKMGYLVYNKTCFVTIQSKLQSILKPKLRQIWMKWTPIANHGTVIHKSWIVSIFAALKSLLELNISSLFLKDNFNRYYYRSCQIGNKVNYHINFENCKKWRRYTLFFIRNTANRISLKFLSASPK